MFGGGIEVERPDDDLHSQVWRFYYFDDRHVLTVDHYSRSTRKTKRHKWVSAASYYRLSRGSVDGHSINEEQVPLPDDVVAEAKQKFMDALRVTRWSDRYPPRKEEA